MSSLRNPVCSRQRSAIQRTGYARRSRHAVAELSQARARQPQHCSVQRAESEFPQPREAYLLRFKPRTEIEADLVEQLVTARWRMERAWAMETALLDLEMAQQQENVEKEFEAIDEEARTALAFRSLCDGSRTLAMLHRYEARHRRAGERILESLRGLQGRGRHENGKLQNEPNPKNEHP